MSSLQTDINTNPPAAARHVPGKVEWGLAIFDGVLLLLWAVRLYDPLFMDGQLLPCMALGFLPGALLTLLRRRALGVHRAGFALALIVFLVWNGTISVEQLRVALFNWKLVLPGIIVLSLQLVTGALRWQLLLLGQDIHIKFFTLLRLMFIGSFFNTFIPGATGGDFYRIYRVSKESHVSTAAVTTSVVIDRFLGLPTLLALVLLGVLLNLDFVRANEEFQHLVKIVSIIFGAGGVVMVAIFAASFFLTDWFERLESRIPGGGFLLRLTKSIAVYKGRPLLILAVLGISIIAHLSTFGAFLFFAEAVHIEGVSASLYLFLVFAGLMVNYLPLAPNGAGQGEYAFAEFFALATPGLDNGPRAATMMICYRIGMLLFGVIGGILYSLGKQHIDFHKPPTGDDPAEMQEAR